TFEEIPVYGLTVNPVGSGTVLRSPDLAGYPAGTEVTLTAVPAAGWQFAGWSGDLTGTEPELAFVINAATSLAATFTPENNTPPTISQLADQAVDEDTALGPVAFVVGDAESQLSDLSVTAASSDPDL